METQFKFYRSEAFGVEGSITEILKEQESYYSGMVQRIKDATQKYTNMIEILAGLDGIVPIVITFDFTQKKESPDSIGSYSTSISISKSPKNTDERTWKYCNDGKTPEDFGDGMVQGKYLALLVNKFNFQLKERVKITYVEGEKKYRRGTLILYL